MEKREISKVLVAISAIVMMTSFQIEEPIYRVALLVISLVLFIVGWLND